MINRQVCRIVCLGGYEQNDLFPLKLSRPAGLELFHVNIEQPNWNKKDDCSPLWLFDADQRTSTVSSTLDQAISILIDGIDNLFIVVGLGGNNSTELALLLSRAAYSKGIKTFCFATLPYEFEGTRNHVAIETLLELEAYVTATLTFDNNLLIKELGGESFLNEAIQTQSRWRYEAILDVYHRISSVDNANQAWPDTIKILELGNGQPLDVLLQSPYSDSTSLLALRASIDKVRLTKSTEQDRHGEPVLKEVEVQDVMPARRIFNIKEILRKSSRLTWKRRQQINRVLRRVINSIFVNDKVVIGIGGCGRKQVERMRHYLPDNHALYSMDLDDPDHGKYEVTPLVCHQYKQKANEPIAIGGKQTFYDLILKRRCPLYIVVGLGGAVGSTEALALAEAVHARRIPVFSLVTMPLRPTENQKRIALMAHFEISRFSTSCHIFRSDRFVEEYGEWMNVNDSCKYQAKSLTNKIMSITARSVRVRQARTLVLLSTLGYLIHIYATDPSQLSPWVTKWLLSTPGQYSVKYIQEALSLF